MEEEERPKVYSLRLTPKVNPQYELMRSVSKSGQSVVHIIEGLGSDCYREGVDVAGVVAQIGLGVAAHELGVTVAPLDLHTKRLLC